MEPATQRADRSETTHTQKSHTLWLCKPEHVGRVRTKDAVSNTFMDEFQSRTQVASELEGEFKTQRGSTSLLLHPHPSHLPIDLANSSHLPFMQEEPRSLRGAR